ncbi:hypothetical protein [Streptomyces canus]|uniref:hypothetical protein n=1 Tax=Streptomyces canus TaxID=58343 RepID=UPI002782F2B1|nr:hypothetical protein [Streptomyces canus]MDQ0761827.1 hypothetical protein [Streptomyces canus]
MRKDALPSPPAEWSRNERDSRACLDPLVRHAKQRMFIPDRTAMTLSAATGSLGLRRRVVPRAPASLRAS